MSSMSVPIATRLTVLKRDGLRCCLCDCSKHLHIHHVLPLNLGGSNAPDNLVTLCWTCHAMAHGRTVMDMPYSDPDGIETEIVQYISDYVAEEEGRAWNPFA